MKYDSPELIDRLAAEYVLGSLRGPARRRFERLRQSLPAANVAVSQWEARLHSLARSIPDMAPPAHVWKAIDTRIDARVGGLDSAEKNRTASWWQNWWRPATGLAFGVVFGIALVQQMPQRFISLDDLAETRQALPQSYVGLLFNEQGTPALLASSTRHGDRLHIKILSPIARPAGKVLKLWALPQDKSGTALPPFLIGEVPPQGKAEIVMPASAEKLLSHVTRLGVSLEDANAATPQPGAFVLTGHCVKLW